MQPADTNSIYPGSFEEFEREAQRGSVVPVHRTIGCERLNPADVYERIARQAPYSFLFESAEGTERVARFSFLGANPEMIVRGRGETTVIERDGASEVLNVRAIDFVRAHFAARTLARRPGLGPLTGGAVGYLGYRAANWFEPAVQCAAAEGDDAVLMFYNTVLAFDRVKQVIDIKSVVFTEEAEGDRSRLQQLYAAAVETIGRVERRALQPADDPPEIPDGVFPSVNDSESRHGFDATWTRDDFHHAVLKVKDHIAAGDCYQAVLSQQFTRPVTIEPLLIYRALHMINPSPYMYLLRLGEESVIGASPEMLVRCRGPRLDYRPIAGTRRRGTSPAEDWLLANEMRTDEKELSEHMMLVDLGRNDLGRVADYGSVHVDDLATVEAYSHVQHLVSNLRARLRGDLDRFDALASCFPAGTVTGAPKVSAMNIINKLEPVARGIYAGCLLYADYADNLDSCIAIRTIVLRNGIASVQAGAGIVADSDPQREYQETVDKAQALFRAVQLAELEFAVNTR